MIMVRIKVLEGARNRLISQVHAFSLNDWIRLIHMVFLVGYFESEKYVKRK